jgi:hypothetical protein
MFPSTNPQIDQFTTSAPIAQNTSLLGNPQFGTTQNSLPVDAGLANSTAPASSTTNPGVANMIKALKGGVQ